MLRGLLLSAALCLSLLCSAKAADAKLLRVPKKFATIQAALDAAADGDQIRVGPGDYCGAVLSKRVSLIGRGHPRIIGCAAGPSVTSGTHVGFYLPGSKGVNPASGSIIRGFVFDGRGVSNTNLAPLSFGVFARYASDVVVSSNRFEGTVQAITNTGGDRWLIKRNRITRLTLLDCTGRCTGGDGIVIALGRGALAAPGGDADPLNRPENNLVVGNQIEGTPPNGFSIFSMVGVLLLSADHTTVLSNRLQLRDNPAADAVGQGILVSNTCCGLGSSFLPGSRNTTLAFNDGRRSEVAIVVDGTGGANTSGLVLLLNRGKVQVEGTLQPLLFSARQLATPARAQPQL
jgi:hypothetical protein